MKRPVRLRLQAALICSLRRLRRTRQHVCTTSSGFQCLHRRLEMAHNGVEEAAVLAARRLRQLKRAKVCQYSYPYPSAALFYNFGALE